jgi:hypothetical protein
MSAFVKLVKQNQVALKSHSPSRNLRISRLSDFELMEALMKKVTQLQQENQLLKACFLSVS